MQSEGADGMDIDLPALRTLAAEIDFSISALEAATEPSDKANILSSIVQDSQRLRSECTSASDSFSDFTFQPLANGSVRVALSIGLFDHLSTDVRTGSSVHELASLTCAEPDLIERILRVLVAFDIVWQDHRTRLYSHTPMSLIYTEPSRKAWAIWMWDVMIASASSGLGPYFDEHSRPIANPADQNNAPFTVGHGTRDKNVFQIVKEIGKLPLLNNAMSGSSVVCAKEAVSAYNFAALEAGQDGVVLVDVGGAKGQTIQEIQRAYPNLKGTAVLQDLQSVLDDGAVPELDAETMPYDFYKQEQPVKGAAAYLYQRVFHDWNDENSQKILDSLKPAMSPTSKLLICDVVVQDHRPHRRKVLRDMNMLLVGGMERSERQWNTLLESRGFVIEKIHGLENPDNSVIEARVA